MYVLNEAQAKYSMWFFWASVSIEIEVEMFETGIHNLNVLGNIFQILWKYMCILSLLSPRMLDCRYALGLILNEEGIGLWATLTFHWYAEPGDWKVKSKLLGFLQNSMVFVTWTKHWCGRVVVNKCSLHCISAMLSFKRCPCKKERVWKRSRTYGQGRKETLDREKNVMQNQNWVKIQTPMWLISTFVLDTQRRLEHLLWVSLQRVAKFVWNIYGVEMRGYVTILNREETWVSAAVLVNINTCLYKIYLQERKLRPY